MKVRLEDILSANCSFNTNTAPGSRRCVCIDYFFNKNLAALTTFSALMPIFAVSAV